jgi:hemerythrin-like metal-binding protein
LSQDLYIVWQASQETGIPILDEQHRGLVSTINSFHHFLRGGQGALAFGPTLSLLMAYARLHFQTEEALLREAGYPHLDLHRALHGDLARKLEDLKREGPSSAEDDLLPLLKAWWLGHIAQEDRKFVGHLWRHQEGR